MKKILLRLILILVILVVVVVAVGLIFINPIAKSGVEKGTTAALGVDTTVDKVSISLLNGQVVLDGLNVSNPEGFITTHLVHAGKFDIQVDPRSLFSDTVEIRKFELDGVDLHIEQKLPMSNVAKIIDNIKRSSAEQEKTKSDGKKVKAELVLIKNVVAYFHLLPGSSKAGTLKVEVPQIELKNVSSDKTGSVAGELVSQLFPAILASIIREGQGLIPTEFLNDLDSQVMDLAKSLGEGATELIKPIGQGLETTIKDAGLDKAAEGTGKVLEEGAEGAKKAIQGLFGEKEKEE